MRYLIVGTTLVWSLLTGIANAQTEKEAEARAACAGKTEAIAAEVMQGDEAELSKLTDPDAFLFVVYLRANKFDGTGCFADKDVEAAKREGRSLEQEVIGGMDGSLKALLYKLCKAADTAGFLCAILSGYRDDDRQKHITSGVHARPGHSYHGGNGSRERGWGHGEAVDLKTVCPLEFTEEECETMNEKFLRFVDEHPGLGIGRPYCSFDPFHMGALDGKEYRSKHPDGRPCNADVGMRVAKYASKHRFASREYRKHFAHLKLHHNHKQA